MGLAKTTFDEQFNGVGLVSLCAQAFWYTGNKFFFDYLSFYENIHSSGAINCRPHMVMGAIIKLAYRQF